MSLWAWSCEVWARSDNRETLMRLQDDHQQCVPLLLWGAWRHELHDAPDELTRIQAVDICRAWNDGVVLPLRNARRRWRALDQNADAVGALGALEVKAERSLLDALEPLPGTGDDGSKLSTITVGESLSLLSGCWGHVLSPAAFESLAHV